MKQFVMECSLVDESTADIVRHLRDIASSIEAGINLGSMPGQSLQGYDWYVDDLEYDEDVDEEDEEDAELERFLRDYMKNKIVVDPDVNDKNNNKKED